MDSVTTFLTAILAFLLQLLTLIVDFFISILTLVLHFAQMLVGMVH